MFGIDKASIMIGRVEESNILREIISEQESSMIAVVGRRRIGKTYLIETTYKDNIVFNLMGQQHAERGTQLENFADKLQEYSKSTQPLKVPKNWKVAFDRLREYLIVHKTAKKKVVFFDELPWLDTHRSGFLSQLSYFWNDWAVKNDIIVVICGSAASWMINKVVNHRGGLHNRINHLLELQPFTLTEVKQYFHKNHIKLDEYQIIQLYMAIGGVPHYLKQVRTGETASQNIQRICFSSNGLLRNEFHNLYAALFDHPEGHIEVIRALSKKWKGLTRKEIIKYSQLSNGGGLSKVLEELNRSSFITSYQPYGKKKRQTLYRLTDEYSLFYLTFIEGSTTKDNVWQQLSQKQSVKAWQGYAYESLCLKHIDRIKSVLGISGLYTEESGFVHAGDDTMNGIQIDLLMDRPDNAIHLCEMKFYNDHIAITKEYAEKLRNRRSAFQYFTKTKKFLFTTLITTYGLNANKNSLGLIDHVITMDQLFD